MLQIQLLGQFDIRADGKRVSIPSRPAQSLFAFLVLTAGTAHRREKLAGMFWPDLSDEHARKNLRHELWRIRKALSGQQTDENDYLIANEFTLGFNPNAEYWLDVSQLERPDLDLPALISNLSAYQGDLLPGFYEDWIALERERIQSIFEARMTQLLDQLITAERWLAVQEWSERWLAFGNTPEFAYRALMLAYGARGDIAKVTSTYRRCTEELLEHLGVEPSAETRALYDGLRKGTHTPRSATLQQSGTITFLFTDIEGSTHLLDFLGDQYSTVLADHHKILRTAIQKWNGYEVDTQGDSFFATFNRALSAVQCATEIQRTIAAHPWAQRKGVRVRMGLHTGEPMIASTGYVGMDVHRAARIGDAGHGGQVLLSQTTRELVIHDLPLGVAIQDLGEHRLKDLNYPTPIYQLVIEGLPSEFPPLRTKFTGTEAPAPGEAPFKGLQFFEEADSDIFFGRELLTAKLASRLREISSPSEKAGLAAGSILVIIGASGSGKSSLVRAGLVPALRKGQTLSDGAEPPEGSADWRIHVITPTAHPLEALATDLTRDSESVTATATLMDDLIQDPRSLSLFLARQTPKGCILLVLDQFEELFTLCHDEFEREAFIDNLLATVSQSDGKAILILTLRADFYAHLAQYPELRDAVAMQQEYIGPMNADELRRAIEEPVKRGHWEFEAGLVDLILRDVGDEPGALPLLSHALLETWKRRAGHRLTLKGYADAGGVHGAIAHTAENVYQNLSTEEQIITRNLFLRLTELGEGTEDTRRRASFEELMSPTQNADEVRAVMNILAEARLITLGEDTVEVAHEALIREWPTLREWLNHDREGLQLHRHLTEAAQDWEVVERDPSILYRGSRLAQANEWSALNPSALNAQEKMFLDESNQQARHEEQEREEQRERELAAAKELAETQRQAASRLRVRNRLITAVGAIAIILALVAVIFGAQSNQHAIAAENNAATAQVAREDALDAQAVAEDERLRAENEKRLTASRELAGNALINLEVDPERSILLAMQAVTTTYAEDGTTTKEAAEALHQAVLNSRLRLALYPQPGDGYGLAISPDGKRLVTSGGNGEIKLWDLASRTELFTLSGHEGHIYSVSFSPDGARLASASADGTAKVWDLDTREMALDLHGHTGEVFTAVFSEEGDRIVTSSLDGTARVWDASNGQLLLTFEGHEAPVVSADFSPDGTRIASVGEDHAVRVWDSASGEEFYMLSDLNVLTAGVTFSPDGKLLATNGGNDPRLWDAETGELLFLLPGLNSLSAQPPVFTPDGKYVAVAAQDGSVSMWDTETGLQYLEFGTGSPIDGQLEFTPECIEPPADPYSWCGVVLVTDNRDGSVRFWDVSPMGNREVMGVPGWWNCLERETMLLHTTFVEPGENVHFHTRQLPEVSSVVKPANPLDHGVEELSSYSVGLEDEFGRAVFTPDCSRSAVVDVADLVVTVTDTASGKELLQFELPEGMPAFQAFGGNSFSPDGTRLALLGPGDTASVWDLENGGEQLLTLQGHTAPILTVNFSPDGKQLATTSFDTTVKLWDAETGQELHTFTEHIDVTTRTAFNPQGSLLAAGSFDGSVKVWDLETGKELYTLPGHEASAWAIAFSPDGKFIATGGNDRTLRFWDSLTGEELLTLPIPAPSLQVLFSPDQTRLVVQSPFGTNVYLTRIEDLLALASSRVSRSLTTEECQKYLHLEACPTVP